MANLVIRRDGGPMSTQGSEIEPFRLMRDFLRFDPFREMAPMWPLEQRVATFVPAFDVRETKDSYIFKADMPGIKPGDVDISVTGNRMTVSGKREAEHEDKSDTWYSYERASGSFTRSFTLPEGVDTDHVKAELVEGVLTLAMPKTPEAQPRRIEIGSGQGSKKS